MSYKTANRHVAVTLISKARVARVRSFVEAVISEIIAVDLAVISKQLSVVQYQPVDICYWSNSDWK